MIVSVFPLHTVDFDSNSYKLDVKLFISYTLIASGGTKQDNFNKHFYLEKGRREDTQFKSEEILKFPRGSYSKEP